jgi:transposase
MTGILFNEDEMNRICVIRKVMERRCSQKEAGIELGLSDRQVRRMLKRFKSEGVQGAQKKHKGGNRSFKEDFKDEVIRLVKEHYHDFGPKFASEKLLQKHNLEINRETLRQWMMTGGIWKGRTRKKARIHQQRERRSCFGELVQIDGSHHDWFEGRAPKCCLLVFIDDATSRIVCMRFKETETTAGYMRLILKHITTHGRPLAYYSDKHSIFITTRQHSVDGRLEDTQVQRALRTLQINLICAHSSQAKGRVERANKTLQDRLIKEMRLGGVSSIGEGNVSLEAFVVDYNRQFSVAPASSGDAHKILYHSQEQLKNILSIHETRKLSKNLEFSHRNKIYQIVTKTTGYRLRHKEVNVYTRLDGEIVVMADNKELSYDVMDSKHERYQADSKEINALVDALVYTSKVLPTGSTAQAHYAL